MAPLQEDIGNLGITMRCIRGEEWPTASFRSLLDLKGNEVTEDAITLHCPVGHSFTLQQAVAKGIFPEDVRMRVLALAKQQFPQMKKELEEREREGWRARPSSYIPNAEVVAKGWPCVKCHKPAQWAPFTPRGGTQRNENRALCLECKASWENFGTDSKEAFDVFQNSSEKPYWRPIQLFDGELWKKFILDEPPATKLEAETLFPVYLERARQEVKDRARSRRQAKR